MTQIALNSFVRRQTKESPFSWTRLRDEELLALLHQHFDKMEKGYREGVVLIPVPPEGFFSAVVKLEEGDVLLGAYERRKPGEEPRKNTHVQGGRKLPAKQVRVVLYASTVLAEDGDNELPAEPDNWEVISINAQAVEGVEPLHPDTLMANHFKADGGTATNMSPEVFEAALRESFEYWKDKAMVG